MPRGIPGSGPKPKTKTMRRPLPVKGAIESIRARQMDEPVDASAEIAGSVTVLTALPRVETYPTGSMRPEALVAATAAVLMCAYDQATAGFRNTPSADRWVELEDAMYAWQYWRDCDDGEKIALVAQLVQIGVGHWPKAVRKAQELYFKGKRQGL